MVSPTSPRPPPPSTPGILTDKLVCKLLHCIHLQSRRPQRKDQQDAGRLGKEDCKYGEGGEASNLGSCFLTCPLTLPRQLPEVPFRILAAMQDDGFRKPKVGMWNELKRLYGQQDVTIGEFNPVSLPFTPLTSSRFGAVLLCWGRSRPSGRSQRRRHQFCDECKPYVLHA
jgi:hypothetical protein